MGATETISGQNAPTKLRVVDVPLVSTWTNAPANPVPLDTIAQETV